MRKFHVCVLYLALLLRHQSSRIIKRIPLMPISMSFFPSKIVVTSSLSALSISNDLDRHHELSKSQNFSRNSTVHGNIEKLVRYAVAGNNFDVVKEVLSSLTTFIISEQVDRQRTIFYILVETCRKAKKTSMIVPLLRLIPVNVLSDVLLNHQISDDIMPFLNNAAKERRDQTGDSMQAVQELVDFIHSHQKVDVFTRLLSIKAYSLIVKGYGRINDEAMLERTLMDISDRVVLRPTVNDIVDVVLLNGAMDSYIRCGNSQKCVELFRYSMNPNNESGNRNEKIWRCFRSNNIQPNIRTFNTILKAYRDNRGDKQYELDDYLSLLQTMKSFSIRPDTITINTIVDACVSCGNISQAKLLLMNLNLNGSLDYPLDKPTLMLPEELVSTVAGVEAYTSLITGLAREGDMYGAFNILDVMISRGVTANARTLGALMNACMQSGRSGLQRAKELIKFEGNKYLTGLTAPEQTALHGTYVISLCSQYRNGVNIDNVELLDDAKTALSNMARNQIAPDTATVNAFLQALCSLARPKVAEGLLLLTAMVDLKIIVPDDYTYSILFKALGKAGYTDQALLLYKTIASGGIVSTAVANSFLGAYTNNSDSATVLDIFAAMTQGNNSASLNLTNSFVPDKVTFTILFVSIAKNIAKAYDAKFLPPSVFPPDSILRSEVAQQSRSDKPDGLRKNYPEMMNAITEQYIRRVNAMNEQFDSIGENKTYNQTMAKYASLLRLYDLIDVYSVNSLQKLVPASFNANGRYFTQRTLPKVDLMLRSLFYQMRYEGRIQPDQMMVKVINSIFAVQIKVARNSEFYARNQIDSSEQGSGSRTLSRDTAKFILEELIIAGFHPREMMDILACCGFSARETDALLSDNSAVIRQLRKSAASYRIFKKHKWNKVDSGWNSLF